MLIVSWRSFVCKWVCVCCLQDLTNVELFMTSREVEESLKRKETGPCLTWCYENRSKLRKHKVNFYCTPFSACLPFSSSSWNWSCHCSFWIWRPWLYFFHNLQLHQKDGPQGDHLQVSANGVLLLLVVLFLVFVVLVFFCFVAFAFLTIICHRKCVIIMIFIYR